MATTRARRPDPVESVFDDPPLDVSPEFRLDADPRDAALAALLQPPPVVTSDLAPPPLPRLLPPPNGYRADWTEGAGGDWYLVTADVYPRYVADVREQARIGDVLRLPSDERTATDVAASYVVPEPLAVALVAPGDDPIAAALAADEELPAPAVVRAPRGPVPG